MPNMNGIDAAKALRSQYGNKIKIFMLTGNVLAGSISELDDLVDGILTKPCSKQDLLRCLESLQNR